MNVWAASQAVRRGKWQTNEYFMSDNNDKVNRNLRGVSLEWLQVRGPISAPTHQLCTPWRQEIYKSSHNLVCIRYQTPRRT